MSFKREKIIRFIVLFPIICSRLQIFLSFCLPFLCTVHIRKRSENKTNLSVRLYVYDNEKNVFDIPRDALSTGKQTLSVKARAPVLLNSKMCTTVYLTTFCRSFVLVSSNSAFILNISLLVLLAFCLRLSHVLKC